MVKIVHITTGLNIGGAEMFLMNLSGTLRNKGFEQTIISLLEAGDLTSRIEANGIQVMHLGINRYPWTWWRLVKLIFLLRKLSPDVIQTWLYHADILGGMASVFSRAKLVWNVRQTDISVKNNKREIYFLARLAAQFSSTLPDRIICVSDTARESHVSLGYQREKIIVIPNGCDTKVFRHVPGRKETVRQELGISDDEFVVARFGRFDVQKDYRNFVSAARILLEEKYRARFLMAGENITMQNPELNQWISETGLEDSFILLGKRPDLPDLYQAVDVLVSSSLGEGFPNVVAEAMASEIPCVVTDVGESGSLVGETGRTVPREDSHRLARSCIELLELDEKERQALGTEARKRVVENFSLEKSAEDYSRLYQELVGS